ncbi:polyamine aminopropyltransferase [Treponema sp.]
MRKFLKTENTRRINERLSPSSGWYYEAGETLHEGKTPFQEIELVTTEEFGRTLLLDGATQVMEKNEFQYHESLAHLPLLSHRNPRRVLIIGGGDGGLVREVLKHPCVQSVDFIELDEEVVLFSRRYLLELNKGAFEDPRVKLSFMDGRAFVEAAAPATYDVILMDMTDPAGPSLRLYTQEFFLAVRRILRDDESLFAMHSESPETRPEAFARIRSTLASVFPLVRLAYTYIRMYGTLWSFALCSASTDPKKIDGETIERRLAERGISALKLVSPDTWPAFFVHWPYIGALLTEPGPISTDAEPDFPDSFDPRG